MENRSNSCFAFPAQKGLTVANAHAFTGNGSFSITDNTFANDPQLHFERMTMGSALKSPVPPYPNNCKNPYDEKNLYPAH